MVFNVRAISQPHKDIAVVRQRHFILSLGGSVSGLASRTPVSRTGRSTCPIALYPFLADLELAGFPAPSLPLPRLNHPA
jgi:hypothetical protein